MIQTKFTITNLTCDACVKLSTKALKKIPGVADVRIELATGAAELTSDQPIEWQTIYSALQSVDKQAVQVQ